MVVVLIVILLLLAVGGLPHWPYAQPYAWGYYPSGALTLVVVLLVVLLLMGRL